MMKKISLLFLLITCWSVTSVLATPINIGIAAYSGYEYGLLWDEDTSLIWIDSLNSSETWGNQKAIFRGLNPVFNINPNYQIDWGVSEWRLPEIEEIVNLDWSAFIKISPIWRVWSNTSASYFKAWTLRRGNQETYRKNSMARAITVYDGAQVTRNSPVPEPATMILLSFGIVGLVGLKRRRL